MNWFTLTRIGLIFNTAGAIFLVIASDRIMKIITKYIDGIKENFGKYDTRHSLDFLEKDYHKAKRNASILNLIGYFLFIIGFLLQLISNN